MANLGELTLRIRKVNSEIARLNKERESNLARKKVYEEEFNKNCAQYNEKYGTNIGLDTIDTEFRRVSSDFEAQVTKMEQVVTLVNKGRVSEAEYLLTGKTPEQVAAEKQAEVEAQVQEQVEAQVQSEERVAQAPTVAPTVEASEPVQSVPVTPTVSPVQPIPVAEVPTAPQAAETVVKPRVAEPVVSIPKAPTVAPTVEAPQAPVDLTQAAHSAQGTSIKNIMGTAPTAPEAPKAPTPVFAEDDIMPKPSNPLFGGAPIGVPTPPKAPTVAPTVTAPKVEAPKVEAPKAPSAEPEFKIPTPVGVPSEPFKGTESPEPSPIGAGTVTNDIGAFDEVLRQESESKVTQAAGDIPVPPKPPVNAIPVPPAFSTPNQGTEKKNDVSGALNFSDILGGTNFGL